MKKIFNLQTEKCYPCETWGACVAFPVRRLKPMVNNVPSLRDYVEMWRAAFQFCTKSAIAILKRVLTSFLPNFQNKTTSVENEVTHIINLITSFIAKRLIKLGNEVLKLLTFKRATEVVLLIKLGENEANNHQSKIINQKCLTRYIS